MSNLIPMAGHWVWWIVAALLLVGELVMPGFFLLWLGLAAALTGIVDFLFQPTWQASIVIFALFSGALVALAWKWVTANWQPKSDQPHLNQRHLGMVGRSFVLDRPIVNGTGKIKVDDTLWDVEGKDKAAGSSVTVTGVNGMRLKVE